MRFILALNSGSVPAFQVLTACHDTPSAFKISLTPPSAPLPRAQRHKPRGDFSFFTRTPTTAGCGCTEPSPRPASGSRLPWAGRRTSRTSPRSYGGTARPTRSSGASSMGAASRQPAARRRNGWPARPVRRSTRNRLPTSSTTPGTEAPGAPHRAARWPACAYSTSPGCSPPLPAPVSWPRPAPKCPTLSLHAPWAPVGGRAGPGPSQPCPPPATLFTAKPLTRRKTGFRLEY